MTACTGLEVSLVGMAADEWEVRNAASLAYTTLLLRMLGVRNLVKVPPVFPPSICTVNALA